MTNNALKKCPIGIIVSLKMLEVIIIFKKLWKLKFNSIINVCILFNYKKLVPSCQS